MFRKRWQYTQGIIWQQERKKAITHTVNKKLLYNTIHLQRKPTILCNNDTKSCYDCIVTSVASMTMQRQIIHAQPMKCMIVMCWNYQYQG